MVKYGNFPYTFILTHNESENQEGFKQNNDEFLRIKMVIFTNLTQKTRITVTEKQKNTIFDCDFFVD